MKKSVMQAIRRASWALLTAGSLLGTSVSSAQVVSSPASEQTQFVEQTPGSVEQTAPAMSEDQLRLEVMKVELAWLGHPSTFPYQLGGRANGSSLQVHGFVPNNIVREHALRLARENTSLTIEDAVKLHASLAMRSSVQPPLEVHQAATAILAENLGEHGRSFDLRVRSNGQVTLIGTVNSYEEKLTASRYLRRVRGCTCVINQLNVMPVVRDGKVCTLLTADGQHLVPMEKEEGTTTAPAVAMPMPNSPSPTTMQPIKPQGPIAITAPLTMPMPEPSGRVGNTFNPRPTPMTVPTPPAVKETLIVPSSPPAVSSQTLSFPAMMPPSPIPGPITTKPIAPAPVQMPAAPTNALPLQPLSTTPLPDRSVPAPTVSTGGMPSTRVIGSTYPVPTPLGPQGHAAPSSPVPMQNTPSGTPPPKTEVLSGPFTTPLGPQGYSTPSSSIPVQNAAFGPVPTKTEVATVPMPMPMPLGPQGRTPVPSSIQTQSAARSPYAAAPVAQPMPSAPSSPSNGRPPSPVPAAAILVASARATTSPTMSPAPSNTMSQPVSWQPASSASNYAARPMPAGPIVSQTLVVPKDPYVTTGVVTLHGPEQEPEPLAPAAVSTNSEPAAVSLAPAAVSTNSEPPAVSTSLLKQRIEMVCGNSARDIQVALQSGTNMEVQMKIGRAEDGEKLSTQILEMPELSPFQVALKMQVQP